MLYFLLFCAASAGEILLDAKVPAALTVDGRMLAELYEPGLLRVSVPDGAHTMIVSIAGYRQPFDIELAEGELRVVIAGRNGVSLGETRAAAPMTIGGEAEVEFRAIGPASVMVQVGKTRVVVPPGGTKRVMLTMGEHTMSVRSGDGTSVYSRGVLQVLGGEVMVVQVTEGAVPEASAPSLVFRPDER
jgi:hypothetical protein